MAMAIILAIVWTCWCVVDCDDDMLIWCSVCCGCEDLNPLVLNRFRTWRVGDFVSKHDPEEQIPYPIQLQLHHLMILCCRVIVMPCVVSRGALVFLNVYPALEAAHTNNELRITHHFELVVTRALGTLLYKSAVTTANMGSSAYHSLHCCVVSW
jgi:hypothetical protein